MTDFTVGVKLTADGKQYVDTVNAATGANDKLGQSLSKVASETGKVNAQQGNDLTLREKQVIAAERLAAAESKMLAGQSAMPAVMRSNRVEVESLGDSMKKNDAQWNLYNAQTNSMSKGTAAWRAEMKAAGGEGKAAGTAVAEGMGLMSGSAIAASFSTAQARRELIVLGHEAVTGNFSRMPGSFMVLAERIGISGGAMVGVLVPLAAIGVVAGVMIKAFADGAKEMHEMDNALAMTSGFAGLTRGTMILLAQSVSDAGTLTIGTSKQLVTQLVASGKLGAQSIGAVAKLAEDYAAATGRDIDKIAPELVKLFENPSKSAAELNKQMHSMEPAFIEHLAHLERIGQVEEARLAFADKVGQQVPKTKAQLGLLGKAWDAVTKAASAAWDAMLSVGREKTLEEKLADAAKNLNALQNMLRPNAGMISAAQKYFDEQVNAAKLSQEEGDKRRAGAAQIDLRSQAAALVGQTAEYQKIKVLKDNLLLLGNEEATAGLSSVEIARAKFNTNKQIEDTYRSMGAESRALYEGEIAGNLTIQDLQTKMAQEQNDSLVKLGVITEQEGIKRRTSMELERNDAAQAANDQLLFAGNLTLQQTQTLLIKSEVLALDKILIANAGENALKAAEHNALLKDREEILRSNASFMEAETAAMDSASLAVGAFIVANRTRLQDIGSETSLLEAEIARRGQSNLTLAQEIELTNQNRLARESANEIKRIEASTNQALAIINTNETLTIQEKTQATNDLIAAEAQQKGDIDTALARLNAAQRTGDVIKENATAQKRLNDDLSQGLIDSIYRGFEAGKGFGQNFWDSMKNMAKTTTLTPVIKFLISPITGAISAAISGLGIPGLGNAATGASGGTSSLSMLSSLSNFFSGGGTTGGLLGSAFGAAGVGGITSAGMMTAAPVYEAGALVSGAEYASLASGAGAMGAVSAAIPYIGAAIAVYSILKATGVIGGGDHPASGTGYQISGAANNQGLAGTFYGLSASDEASYTAPLGDQAGWTQYFNTQLAGARTEIAKLSQLMGVDAAALANKSYAVNAAGPLDMPQTIQIAVLQLTDQMAQDLVPNIKSLQQANESLTQTFVRLAQAVMEAAIPDALGRMGAAMQLKDQWKGIAWGDLNPTPMTSAQKLSALADEYSANLLGARANDMNAYNALGGSVQSYLEQARAEYASSQQYVDIYNAVQSQVGDVIQTTMTDQSNRLADMGLSLHDIVANTTNLDKRIADALKAAIDAWQATHAVVAQAAANQITAAVQENTAATQQAATDTGLVLASAASAGWIDPSPSGTFAYSDQGG